MAVVGVQLFTGQHARSIRGYQRGQTLIKLDEAALQRLIPDQAYDTGVEYPRSRTTHNFR
jgi:hypothetical protein